MKQTFRLVIVFIALCLCRTGVGTPPYLSDSPVPTDYHKFQWYFYSLFFDTNTFTYVQLPALEWDWGFAKEQEVWIANGVTSSWRRRADNIGIGDFEAGYVYRFITETATRPQVGFNPTFFIPTGDSSDLLGFGRFMARMPVSFQKTLGAWTLSGSAGYIFDSLPETTGLSYTGWVAQYAFNEKVGLGTEFYTQQSSDLIPGYSIINLGGYYNFTKNFSFLFAIGNSIGGLQNNQGYLAFTWIV